MSHGAEAEVFGFTFDEVGMALAQQWGMPAELVATLCRVAPPDQPPSDRLHHITQCSADLTRLTYATGATEEHGTQVESLVSAYTRVLGVEPKKIRESLASAQLDSAPTLNTMQLTLDGWKTAREERAAALLRPAEATAEEALQSLASLCEPTESDSASEATVRAAVGALTAVRQHDEAFTIGGATVATLDAARSAGYRRALLALSTEDFKLVRGRMGAGPGHEELLRGFIVRPLSSCGPLGAALQNRTDLFVDVGTAEGRRYKTDRVLKELQSRSLAMLPLVIENKLMGCLYFDNGTEPLEVTDTLRALLLTMRDHLVAAFAKHRSGGVSSAA
ncbi:MAG: hypothetical protein U5K74_11895 [Gemmatimonadaceae bacterium]|nr:hypothetical protein [Gemmatimonadaceae bacterium]